MFYNFFESKREKALKNAKKSVWICFILFSFDYYLPFLFLTFIYPVIEELYIILILSSITCLIFTLLLDFASYLIDNNESFLWYLIGFLSLIPGCLFSFILDKIFHTHCFKIYLLFLILFGIFVALEFNFTQFIMPFVMPTYLIFLFIFTRKKSTFLKKTAFNKA